MVSLIYALCVLDVGGGLMMIMSKLGKCVLIFDQCEYGLSIMVLFIGICAVSAWYILSNVMFYLYLDVLL